MRVDYDSILETYYMCMDSFNELIYSYANEQEQTAQQKTEKDIAKSNNDQKKMNEQASFGNKAVEFIKTLVDKLIASIKIFMEKLSNRIKMVLETDKGFKKSLRQREITVKPVQSLKIITYRYNTPVLEQMINRLNSYYINTLNKIYNNTVSAEEFGKDVDKTMMKIAGGKDYGSINEFLNDMKERFRGKKTAYTYTAQQLGSIKHEAENVSAMTAGQTKIKNFTEDTIKRVKAEADRFRAKGQQADAEKVKSNLVVAQKMATVFMTINSYYIELLIERNISYRTILKKFYQF